MRKILVLSFVLFMMVNSVNAAQLVLSDVIQQARDTMKMREAKEKAELAMMKPACSNSCMNTQMQTEQSAAEKINLYPNKDSE